MQCWQRTQQRLDEAIADTMALHKCRTPRIPDFCRFLLRTPSPSPSPFFFPPPTSQPTNQTTTTTMAFVARDTGSSTARRRRERRLRSGLRHERMTVRMELAAALHHFSFRGAGPETYDASWSQMTANSREDSVFFDLYDQDTEGARPDRLFEVRPQERDQRRTVNRSSTPRSACRRLMFLCRSWRNSWWKCRRSSPVLPH